MVETRMNFTQSRPSSDLLNKIYSIALEVIKRIASQDS
jgi:hypothetical protein